MQFKQVKHIKTGVKGFSTFYIGQIQAPCTVKLKNTHFAVVLPLEGCALHLKRTKIKSGLEM